MVRLAGDSFQVDPDASGSFRATYNKTEKASTAAGLHRCNTRRTVMAPPMDRMVIVVALILAGSPAWINCRPAEPADARVDASQPSAPTTAPATQPVSQPASQPVADLGDPPPPVEIPIAGHGRLSDGWMKLDEPEDAAARAWAEGRTLDDDALIIQTQNVRRFQLDLGHIRLNWQRRILLRIDGFNRELTRPDQNRIIYQKTATGGWEKVAE